MAEQGGDRHLVLSLFVTDDFDRKLTDKIVKPNMAVSF